MKLIVLSDGRSIFKQVVSGMCYTLCLLFISFMALLFIAVFAVLYFKYQDLVLIGFFKQVGYGFLSVLALVGFGIIFDWSVSK